MAREYRAIFSSLEGVAFSLVVEGSGLMVWEYLVIGIRILFKYLDVCLFPI